METNNIEYLFLDDQRQAPKGYILIETIPVMLLALSTGKVKGISIDYYLGDGITSQELIDEMIESELYPQEFICIHTSSFKYSLELYKTLTEHVPATVRVFVQNNPILDSHKNK